MTYREKIQDLTKKIESIYDDAEWLRDTATLEEKKYWNEVRRIFYDTDKPLRQLDNSLSQSRASMNV